MTTTIKRGNLGPVWDKPVPDRWLCLCPNCLSFFDHLRLLLENSPFKNLRRINCLGWNFVQCGRIHFTLAKIMNKLISTKNWVFISLVDTFETGKSQLVYNCLKIGTFQPKFDKIYFFSSTFSTSLRWYAKRNWKSWVCARSKIWFHWFAKKQRYKVFVDVWRFLLREFHFKSLCWHCHPWETSGSEHNLH